MQSANLWILKQYVTCNLGILVLSTKTRLDIEIPSIEIKSHLPFSYRGMLVYYNIDIDFSSCSENVDEMLCLKIYIRSYWLTNLSPGVDD